MRTLEGGNAVDEGSSLAPADREANLAHIQRNRVVEGDVSDQSVWAHIRLDEQTRCVTVGC